MGAGLPGSASLTVSAAGVGRGLGGVGPSGGANWVALAGPNRRSRPAAQKKIVFQIP